MVATATDTRQQTVPTKSNRNILLEKCSENMGSWMMLEVFERSNTEHRDAVSSQLDLE